MECRHPNATKMILEALKEQAKKAAPMENGGGFVSVPDETNPGKVFLVNQYLNSHKISENKQLEFGFSGNNFFCNAGSLRTLREGIDALLNQLEVPTLSDISNANRGRF